MRASRVLRTRLLPYWLAQRFLPNDEPRANARDDRAFYPTQFFPEMRSLSGFHRAAHQPNSPQTCPVTFTLWPRTGNCCRSSVAVATTAVGTGFEGFENWGRVPAQTMIAGRSFTVALGVDTLAVCTARLALPIITKSVGFYITRSRQPVVALGLGLCRVSPGERGTRMRGGG